MRMTYSPKADSLAIELTLGGRAATSKQIAPDTVADFDAEGRLMVIEVQQASAHYPRAALQALASPVVLITVSQASKSSGLAAATIQKQIKNGRIPAEKKGRDWMIPEHELFSYLANRSGAGRPATKRRARRPKASSVT
jgi:excisionase family DNA binding protein